MGRENPTPGDRSRSNNIILRALKWLASTSEGDKGEVGPVLKRDSGTRVGS